MAKVWLISGGARGLGRDIVEAVLASGDQVVAGARDPSRLDALRMGSLASLRVVPLDVTEGASIALAVATAIDQFGRIDVLVNNAGYGRIAPFEQTSEEAFRDQVETNFFGTVDLTRAVLPHMRRQRGGHVINISSVGGRLGLAGMSAYQAAKWAVGGFTEVLAREVSALGIKVISLEPGGMRTGWAEIASKRDVPLLADYQASVGVLIDRVAANAGREEGDPAKVAQIVMRLAAYDELPAHLVLGRGALSFLAQADEDRARDQAKWMTVSLSSDVGYTGPRPPFPS